MLCNSLKFIGTRGKRSSAVQVVGNATQDTWPVSHQEFTTYGTSEHRSSHGKLGLSLRHLSLIALRLVLENRLVLRPCLCHLHDERHPAASMNTKR